MLTCVNISTFNSLCPLVSFQLDKSLNPPKNGKCDPYLDEKIFDTHYSKFLQNVSLIVSFKIWWISFYTFHSFIPLKELLISLKSPKHNGLDAITLYDKEFLCNL